MPGDIRGVDLSAGGHGIDTESVHHTGRLEGGGEGGMESPGFLLFGNLIYLLLFEDHGKATTIAVLNFAFSRFANILHELISLSFWHLKRTS